MYLLEYHDETKSLECSSVWTHNEEITSLSCSPSLSERSLFATTSPNAMRILQVSDNLLSDPKEVLQLKKEVRQVLWDLEGLQTEVRVVSRNAVLTIGLEHGKAGAELSAVSVDDDQIQGAVLDPHHSSLCLLSCAKTGLRVADFRTKRTTLIENSTALHGFGGAAVLDFSPLHPNSILTGGTDGTIALHDIRMESKNTLETKQVLKAHEHSVQKALFNPFHADLLLSCSSDQSLKLWDLSKSGGPTCIRLLADFGDTVVDTCWSGNGPWVFAGVSFNGKVLIDHVPTEKKMSILLEEKK